jgi:hypothetical protein
MAGCVLLCQVGRPEPDHVTHMRWILLTILVVMLAGRMERMTCMVLTWAIVLLPYVPFPQNLAQALEGF